MKRNILGHIVSYYIHICGQWYFNTITDYGGQADVYLEGIDQFKGWFQTSLLTSLAVNGRAPYR